MVPVKTAQKHQVAYLWAIGVLLTLLAGCAAAPSAEVASSSANAPRVLATESFLADIAQNVAGDRLQVDSLIPIGMDPHAFDPTPQDVRKIAESEVVIENGAGFEAWLEPLLENAGGERTIIEASAGLGMREPGSTESAEEHEDDHDADHQHEGDPHFWLDPNNVVRYVETIRDGLIQADPEGREIYTANTAAYIAELNELDLWIKQQVTEIPAERRLLVTNHESFGYFADRYGFTVVGTVIPSVSTGSSPSAQEMARLVDHINEAGATAIFLETGSNPQLARQIAEAAGVGVVTELHTHSLTDAEGSAPNYLEMMRHNVNAIAEALK